MSFFLHLCLLFILTTICVNTDDALVEHPNSAFNNRQKHLFETLVAAYCCLYLNQVYDIVSEKPILVILVVESCNTRHELLVWI